MARPITPEWIESRSEPDLNTGCRLWARGCFQNGYGKHGNRSAHRLSYAAYHGEIPAGAHILHRCDTPACVNPLHLRAGTHSDNMRDMALRGRGQIVAFGEAHPKARLNTTAVHEIRRRHRAGEQQKRIAESLNVNRCTVRDVLTGRTWSHV